MADFFTLALSFFLGYAFYSTFSQEAGSSAHVYLRVGLLATLGGLFLFERIGLYKRHVSVMNVDETRRIIESVLTLSLFLFAYSFFSKAVLSPFFLVCSSCIAPVLLIVERMIFYKLHQYFHLQGFNVNRVLIFGAGEVGRQLLQKVNQSPMRGYCAVGFFDEDAGILNKAKSWFQPNSRKDLLFLSKKEELLEAILSKAFDELFIARPSLHPESLKEIIGMCRRFDIRFSYIPYLYGFFVEQVCMNNIDGIPLVTARKFRVGRSERIGKRVFDLVLSLLSLLLLGPLFLILSVLIRLDSPGSAFFKQARVGKNGREFRIYKFRTMFTHTPAYMGSPLSTEDPRITRLGRFLRRTSLDELPQLINVVRGEMSLVGPRPEMPFVVATYNELQKERLGVRPGITGLWQISAERTRPIHENMAYDIYYIKNRSLLLDVAILIHTALFAIFSMRTC